LLILETNNSINRKLPDSRNKSVVWQNNQNYLEVIKMSEVKHNEDSVTVEIDNVVLLRNVLSIAFSGNHRISLIMGNKRLNHQNNIIIHELYDDSLTYYFNGISNVYSAKFEHIKEITIHGKRFLNEGLAYC